MSRLDVKGALAGVAYSFSSVVASAEVCQVILLAVEFTLDG